MLVIDSDHYDRHGIETMFFPGGEPHIKLPKKFNFKGGDIKLFLKLRTWNDVGIAACLLDVLARRDADVSEVFIPYFPGARQDKALDRESPFTAAIIEALLCQYFSVSVFDPHSDVLQAIGGIDKVYMPDDLRYDVNLEDPVVGIIAPDAGAVDRAEQFRAQFYPDAALVKCEKVRNSRTGQITHYEMGKLYEDGVYIVVDDICDGGGTFNLLAEAFEVDEFGAQSTLDLVVSHGIFSKGLDAISPTYRRIITTDSWCRLPSSGRLKVMPLLSLLNTEPEYDANAGA